MTFITFIFDLVPDKAKPINNHANFVPAWPGNTLWYLFLPLSHDEAKKKKKKHCCTYSTYEQPI